MMKKVILSAIVLMVSAFAFAQTRTAPVKVEGGMIEGVVIDGVNTYLGIPFAAPPVGELRWKEPQPVQLWQGVRLCDRFAPAPMQNMNARRAKTWKNVAEMNPTTSEDCLYLNVFAPAKKSDKPYPVMVWIYGGGFHQGGTDGPVYRGNKYAKEGVIMVSIAYRLGVFGYLAHPELSKESGHGSGNYALYDQIAGLKWVKENIASRDCCVPRAPKGSSNVPFPKAAVPSVKMPNACLSMKTRHSEKLSSRAWESPVSKPCEPLMQ